MAIAYYLPLRLRLAQSRRTSFYISTTGHKVGRIVQQFFLTFVVLLIEGVGQGLASCKSVVEWVNGEIGEDWTGRARGALFGQTCPVGG